MMLGMNAGFKAFSKLYVVQSYADAAACIPLNDPAEKYHEN
jgi:hypothetical protein